MAQKDDSAWRKMRIGSLKDLREKLLERRRSPVPMSANGARQLADTENELAMLLKL